MCVLCLCVHVPMCNTVCMHARIYECNVCVHIDMQGINVLIGMCVSSVYVPRQPCECMCVTGCPDEQWDVNCAMQCPQACRPAVCLTQDTGQCMCTQRYVCAVDVHLNICVAEDSCVCERLSRQTAGHEPHHAMSSFRPDRLSGPHGTVQVYTQICV